ncbi:carbamoyltransferase family protein [Saccharothrix xinjiangensis]|uniref:Carbamoyltransferase n=1 Tax=Saccharothrix xinjiangensis TaxID=204798 RepID=A0ABV9YFW9_9PSEU
MIVVGVSALYHDSACAVYVDGELVAAAHEERFSRARFDPAMPVRAFRSCLRRAGVGVHEVDLVGYYEQPREKLARQLWTDLPRHVVGRPAALLRLDASRPLREIRDLLGYDGPVEFVTHHEAHAASAFYCSGFPDAAVLVVDAVGEWSTTSLGRAGEDGVEVLEDVRFPHSLGLLYSTLTSYLGFSVNSDEYKVMGLAPYGTPRHRDAMDALVTEHEGGFALDLDFFDFADDRRMYTDALVEALGVPPREPGDDVTREHEDLAASVQSLLESLLLKQVDRLHRLVPSPRLCYAGGVALNCVANSVIRAKGPFREVFVQPAAGDAGSAIGAAALVAHRAGRRPTRERLVDVRLGFAEPAGACRALLTGAGVPFTDLGSDARLADAVAGRLAGGAVVGWFQGAAEFGPRALGSRSILADPRDAAMRDRINALVKKREAFRPFAPAVAAERAAEFFELDVPSPFMLETVRVVPGMELPAITHVDGSARVQTVDAAVDPRFHALLTAFGDRTGYPVLLNTSFNMRGEPIVNTAGDALACFLRSDLDVLVLDDLVVDRADVPERLRRRLADVAPYRAPSISESVYTFF